MLKLALHARKTEEKEPPQACGQQHDHKGDGCELHEGFSLADEARRDEEGFERTKADDGEAKDQSSASPNQGGKARPRP